MAKLSIIVLQYNKSDYTLRCLEALKAFDAEIIVVDNGSEVQHLKNVEFWISTHAKSYKLIANEANLGYSGGNNIGIKYALDHGAEKILILNNDVVVEPDFLDRLLRIDKKIVGVESGEIKWLKTELPISKERPNSNTLPPNHYLSGLALLVHREVFEKIGLLDEKYFLYFEDVEFSIRARKAGYDLGIARTKYTHAISATTSTFGPANLLYYHTRNALLFNKTYGPWWVQITLPIWAFWIKLKQKIKIIFKNHLEESNAILSGVKNFQNKNFGIKKTS